MPSSSSVVRKPDQHCPEGVFFLLPQFREMPVISLGLNLLMVLILKPTQILFLQKLAA